MYRATDTALQRPVALKFLTPEFTRDIDARRRFVRRQRLRPRSTIPTSARCTRSARPEDGSFFIVMACYPGETLRERVRRGPLPWLEAARLVAQAAAGLAQAHERGIVHRDVKPANLFVTTDGTVKLLDFGLAKLAGASVMTRRGLTLGTVGYMSPEQARGEAVDHRTDIWSLGVVLYELVAGRRPFRGEYAQAVIYGILQEAPPPLAEDLGELPPVLLETLRRCLEKHPQDRLGTAHELATALGESLGSEETTRVEALETACPGRSSGRRRIRKVVVLPLLNLSPDPEQEYFADGMTEALIADLAKIRALHVISRTSSMRYKSTDKSLPEIAAELGVDGVLEGSVLRVSKRVRITAQLIHAATDTHLWAESYERDLEDVLLLQSEIVRAIVGQIRIALTPAEARRLTSRAQVNPEAYDACLKGRFHWHKLSREHLDIALKYFHVALEKDPICALAWAGIALTWLSLTDAGFVPPHEAIPKTKEAALRALELDESLTEARVSLANMRFCCDWDWSSAERDFRKAIELDPNSGEAHFFYADFLISMGRCDEAAVERARALELDPFSFFIQGFFGWHLVYLRRCDDAITHLHKTLQMEADFSSAHLGLWGAFYRKGLPEEALNAANRFFVVLGDSEVVEALQKGSSESGYEGAMRLAALALERRADTIHVPAVRIARLWAHAGDVGRALDWLEKAYIWRESPLVHLRVGWDWDSLRDHPRFQNLLRRMNLPTW